MMFSCYPRVEQILFIGIFANAVYQVKNEVFVDGTKGLKRHSEHGLAYANFAAHKFHYLNIIISIGVCFNERYSRLRQTLCRSFIVFLC